MKVVTGRSREHDWQIRSSAAQLIFMAGNPTMTRKLNGSFRPTVETLDDRTLLSVTPANGFFVVEVANNGTQALNTDFAVAFTVLS